MLPLKKHTMLEIENSTKPTPLRQTHIEKTNLLWILLQHRARSGKVFKTDSTYAMKVEESLTAYGCFVGDLFRRSVRVVETMP
ncbi:hypothetical protein pdam_00008629 [Pocillopora damicornis]|uniref:Uncharacterized protein n=1 Tax=Pocillopora damicornis TaxID=46731 RepID=A0A3M6U7R9_POCDA|nr:hypothetical protein pdam_00008629 [Pocillopora damicornis]